MAFNQGIYNQIIAMGGSAASAQNAARAKRPGRAFRRFQQAFVPPAPATPQYTPPPMPRMEQYQPPEQTNATIASVGQGVSTPKPKRKTLASLRIKRDRPTRVNTSFGGGYGSGTGLNVGGIA